MGRLVNAILQRQQTMSVISVWTFLSLIMILTFSGFTGAKAYAASSDLSRREIRAVQRTYIGKNLEYLGFKVASKGKNKKYKFNKDDCRISKVRAKRDLEDLFKKKQYTKEQISNLILNKTDLLPYLSGFFQAALLDAADEKHQRLEAEKNAKQLKIEREREAARKKLLQEQEDARKKQELQQEEDRKRKLKNQQRKEDLQHKREELEVNGIADDLNVERDNKAFRKKLIYGVVGFSIAALALVAISYGSDYLNEKIRTPSVVIESSVNDSLLTWLMPGIFKKKEMPKLSLDNLILQKKTKDDITEIASLAKEAKNTGLNYSNLLLYGPPGTGKTYAARIIAQQSGLDYAIVSGSAFTQFAHGKEIEALDNLFKWAENSKDGLILFIDEAETLLRKRDGRSMKFERLLNHFLSRVQRASDPKLMFIFATNHPNRLDPALDTRISRRILVPLPGQKERTDLLKLYIKHEVADKGFEVSDEVYASLPGVAAKLEGASGRAIQDLAVQIQQMLMLTKKKSLETEDVDKVASRLVRQKSEAVSF